jgi:hypothetical protein
MKKITKILKYFSLSLFSIFYFLFSYSKALAVAATGNPKWTDINLPNPSQTLVGFLTRLIEWLMGFAGLFAAIAIIYSGILYISAGGDAEKAAKARKNLLWAFIGIVIIMFSYAIVRSIDQIITITP